MNDREHSVSSLQPWVGWVDEDKRSLFYQFSAHTHLRLATYDASHGFQPQLPRHILGPRPMAHGRWGSVLFTQSLRLWGNIHGANRVTRLRVPCAHP